MSEFKNTIIDDASDQATMDAIIEGTIVEFSDNIITEISGYNFTECKELLKLDLPLVTVIPTHCMTDCTSLYDVNFPEVVTIEQYAFMRCSAISQLNLPKLTYMEGVSFFYCSSLKMLILKSPTMCTMVNINCFSGTPIASHTGFVYVPKALLEDYKTATNWSTYATQIRAIEDWTDDGTMDDDISFARRLIARTITEHADDTTVKLSDHAFAECRSLTKVDLGVCTEFGSQVFLKCTSLETLILRGSRCVTCYASAFNESSVVKGTCYIYVPSTLVDTYKAHSVWSAYSSQIRAIEDYPEITGGA